MSDRLEGWSYPVSETVPISGLKMLDHTFVKAPRRGPEYFDCFGGHGSPKSHALVGAAGDGDYAVANCYRLPLGLPDTAGLGAYAMHGVCHQAANRFLWSACGPVSGPTVFTAQGYAFSSMMYGTYGRSLATPPPPALYVPGPLPPADFVVVYAKCRLVGMAPAAPGEEVASPPQNVQHLIVAVHQQLHGATAATDPNRVLDEELRLVVQDRLGTEVPHEPIQEIRSRGLRRAHVVATSDLDGEAFAHELNAVGARLLDELESHLGPTHYATLMQMEPGERFALVNPELADRAGTNGARIVSPPPPA